MIIFNRGIELMDIQEKGKLIGLVITTLRFTAWQQKKPFNEGEMFFNLAFKSDDELNHIARLTGVKN